MFSIGQAGPSANSKVNVAMIGAGNIAGQAYGGTLDENMVALCDVDSMMIDRNLKKHPLTGREKPTFLQTKTAHERGRFSCTVRTSSDVTEII